MKNSSLHLLQDKQKKSLLMMGSKTNKTKSKSRMKWLNKRLQQCSSESNKNKKKPKSSSNYKDLKKRRSDKKRKQRQRKNV